TARGTPHRPPRPSPPRAGPGRSARTASPRPSRDPPPPPAPVARSLARTGARAVGYSRPDREASHPGAVAGPFQSPSEPGVAGPGRSAAPMAMASAPGPRSARAPPPGADRPERTVDPPRPRGPDRRPTLEEHERPRGTGADRAGAGAEAGGRLADEP